MKDQKLKELLSKEKAYNQGMNEGGEGYNPYTSKIKEEMDRRRDAEPVSLQARKGQIIHEMSTYPTNSNDFATNPEWQKEYAALAKELKEIKAKIHDKWAAEWTLEETKKRRIEWNVRVKAGEVTGANGQIDNDKYKKFIAEMGFDARALGEAVKYYNLKKEKK